MATPAEQLEAMQSLGENWDGYGAAAPQASVLDLAREFSRLIEAMLAKSASAPAKLQVSPTRVGGVLIEWEDQTMQHELELNPDRSLSFLHLDKETGPLETRKTAEVWTGYMDGAVRPGEPVASEVLGRL
jgi:hypothetical protein